jgi:hypothetical protein
MTTRKKVKYLTPAQIKFIRKNYKGALGQFIGYSRKYDVSMLQVKNALGDLYQPRPPRMGKNTSVPHRGIAQKKDPKVPVVNKGSRVISKEMLAKARLLKTKIELTLLKQQLEISAKKHPLRVSQLVNDAAQLVHRYTTLLERAKNILKIAQDLDGKNA